jgi:hypothetical protein
VNSLSPPFEVLSGMGHFMLRPGETLSVVIGFSPVASGMVISTLVINSTAPSQPAVYVRIEAEGPPREMLARRRHDRCGHRTKVSGSA